MTIKRTKQLKIMLSIREGRQLQQMADLSGVNVSTFVRQMVRKKYATIRKRISHL